jgi:hypothetical protein
MNKQESTMTRWTLVAAASALFAAALWHLPATAQRTAPAQNAASALPQIVVTRTAVDQPAPRASAPQLITFDEYREFRLNNIAERRARLTRALTAADLSAIEKASLEGRKAYYDRLAAMPADQRDRQFRDRFDQIDTNHDGMIDNTERTAWREKQREHYHELVADHAPANAHSR